MSLYEFLVFVALAAVGGYAYHLYRSDGRRPSSASDADKADGAAGQLMFRRASPDRVGNGSKSGARD